MTGTLEKFYVQHGIRGPSVMARSDQLTGTCTSDAEIDSRIEMLKNDLDACANEMKRVLKINSSGLLFEGWPSLRDDVSES